MFRRLTPVLAAALLLGACGSDDSTLAPAIPATASTSTPATTPSPSCPFNATGTIRSIDRKKEDGRIRGNARYDRIRFELRDVVRGTPRVGANVIFKFAKNGGGGRATCVRVR